MNTYTHIYIYIHQTCACVDMMPTSSSSCGWLPPTTKRGGDHLHLMHAHIHMYIYVHVCIHTYETCACVEIMIMSTSRGSSCLHLTSRGWDDHLSPTRDGLQGIGMTPPSLEKWRRRSPIHHTYIYIHICIYIYMYIFRERRASHVYIYIYPPYKIWVSRDLDDHLHIQKRGWPSPHPSC